MEAVLDALQGIPHRNCLKRAPKPLAYVGGLAARLQEGETRNDLMNRLGVCYRVILLIQGMV